MQKNADLILRKWKKKSSFHPKENKKEQEIVYSEAILTDCVPGKHRFKLSQIPWSNIEAVS